MVQWGPIQEILMSTPRQPAQSPFDEFRALSEELKEKDVSGEERTVVLRQWIRQAPSISGMFPWEESHYPGMTLPMLATLCWPEVFEEFLCHPGFSMAETDKAGNTVLHHALFNESGMGRRGLGTCTRKILEAGGFNVQVNDEGETPLVRAAQFLTGPALEEFLSFVPPSELDRPDERGRSLMERVMPFGITERIEALLQAGSNPNPVVVDPKADTLLQLAGLKYLADVLVPMLLRHGADARASFPDFSGNTDPDGDLAPFLFHATPEGSFRMEYLEELVRRRDFRLTDCRGRTVFHRFVQGKVRKGFVGEEKEWMEGFMVTLGPEEINTQPQPGEDTVLSLFIQENRECDMDFIRLLLGQGADSDAPGRQNRRPLSLAMSVPNAPEVVRLLMASGASPEAAFPGWPDMVMKKVCPPHTQEGLGRLVHELTRERLDRALPENDRVHKKPRI
jgi:ankyrin repeat protein